MSKIIEKTVVSKYAPHDTNVDWLDVSGDKPVKKSYVNGKWQVIGGSGSGSDYQSSGSIVKDMIEQGTNFNWGKYAIDIPSLPCFKPEAEWPDIPEELSDPASNPTIESILAEGYTTVKYPSSAGVMDSYSIFVVKQTGDNPTISVPSSGEPTFTDCEPVVICENNNELTSLTPVRTPTSSGAISGTTDDEVRVLLAPVEEVFGVDSPSLNGRLLVVVMPQGKVYVGYHNTASNPGYDVG